MTSARPVADLPDTICGTSSPAAARTINRTERCRGAPARRLKEDHGPTRLATLKLPDGKSR